MIKVNEGMVQIEGDEVTIMSEHLIIYKLKHKLVHDIDMITKKLHTHEFGENYINSYRRVRLKGMRTKANEILRFIENLGDEENE